MEFKAHTPVTIWRLATSSACRASSATVGAAVGGIPSISCRSPRYPASDLVVKPDEPPLTLSDDLRLKAPIPIPRRVDPDLPVLGDPPARPRRAAPGGAHTQDGRSARPPSPAPPAAGSARPTARVRDPIAISSLDHRPQSGAINGVIDQPLAKPGALLAGSRRGRRRLAQGPATGSPRDRNTYSLKQPLVC